MKRVLTAGLFLLLALAAAYGLGAWPERNRALAAEAEVARLTEEVAGLDAQVRLGRVLGDALRLSDALVVQNYGEAAALSSGYFDRLRDEAAMTSPGDVRDTLTTLLRTRDQVTSAIARAEPSAAQTIRAQELAIRTLLGYPVG
jgi:hypothetical protein